MNAANNLPIAKEEASTDVTLVTDYIAMDYSNHQTIFGQGRVHEPPPFYVGEQKMGERVESLDALDRPPDNVDHDRSKSVTKKVL